MPGKIVTSVSYRTDDVKKKDTVLLQNTMNKIQRLNNAIHLHSLLKEGPAAIPHRFTRLGKT